MDRRSWPWKKKSSDKSAGDKATATLDSSGVSLPSGGSQTDKDNYKNPNYVQISAESYARLTGLDDQVKTYKEQLKASDDQVKTYKEQLKASEDQVKTYKEHLKAYEDQVKTYEDQLKTYEDQLKTLDEQIDELNEKLSAAHTEMTNKEELVKQHAKVAEEAVSGWEKAETEAATLKTHLEAVTISKLTAEDRAAHVDGALKECMRQIRNLKEEHEQRVQDVVLTKNMQYDKLRREFEAKFAEMDHELLRAEAENDALSRSLQERSNMLINMTEEKSQAEAEIELLKSNIETCEREINSLKYELHIVAKELEIRNEEKSMSAKSAEVANRQHLEGVKKIAKLEAECQRLRGLVRKKLPGPAAVAQMKMEVESLGRDYGRRSPSRPATPMSPVSEFSLEIPQKFQKENEFLTERLLAMEEETKILKEALSQRNNELQASRTMCSKTSNKLQSLEVQLQTLSKHKISAGHPSFQAASMASFSEDGIDDAASVAESWASAFISDLSNVKHKSKDRSSRCDSTNHLELMDDFLEMEKLARSSNDSNGGLSIANGTTDNKVSETVNIEANVANGTDHPSDKQTETNLPSEAQNTTPDVDLMMVKLRILKVFESVSDDTDIGKILEEIKHIVQETQNFLHPHPVSCVFVEKHCAEDAVITSDKGVSLLENGVQNEKLLSKETEAAISEIHAFVLSLRKEAGAFQGASDNEDGLKHKIELFSASYKKVLCSEITLTDFVVSLSDVVAKVSDLSFNFMGYKCCEVEVSSPDCIDKVALPENKEAQADRYPNGCSHASDSSSNPEIPSEANILPGFDTSSCKCSFDEFEHIKAEKDNMKRGLAGSKEELETTRSQLKETEQLLAEVRSQLASSEKANSLAETQLKCMAGSYKSLEKRAQELESEVNLLQTKVESLEIELQSEKANHQDALVRCMDLEEQLKRNEDCSVCSSVAADVETKGKQDKELAAAAAKLAECQETIFLLGRHLNSFRPQTDVSSSPLNESNQRVFEGITEEEGATNADQAEIEATNLENVGVGMYNAPSSPAMSLKSPKHRRSKSGSSSTSSTPTPEKHARGFSRFFSSKGGTRR